MKLIKEITFALALTAGSIFGVANAQSHEIKFGELVIGHPWARTSPTGTGVVAGFMTITNNGKQDDRLIKVTAEISPTTQIHEMKMVGDVMKMAELPGGILIPAGKTVALKPKSLHVMFIGVSEKLEEGEEFSGTLTFERAGTVEVDFEVAAPDAHTN
ncbi:copper chaperone PCu(A)C [Aestuariivirga sp.]|uniref:copper chaperone PCu(A)C n=1 Tax=Aestuariivirga sp. TaxID=2650926 RepID=UPI003BAC898B